MSKTIPFDTALNIVESAYAVVVDDDEILYPGVDGDSITLNSEHYTRINIYGDNNETVKVSDDGMNLIFKDDQGEKISLMLLNATKIA